MAVVTSKICFFQQNISRFRSSKRILQLTRRGAFFSSKDKEAPESDEAPAPRKHKSNNDGPDLHNTFQALSGKSSVKTSLSYTPLSDLEEKMASITADVCGTVPDWTQVSLENPDTKYKILTRFIKELQHDIPNSLMTKMETVADAMEYFRIERRDTTALQDLSKLPDLPKNLHIQQNYVRFDPKTDTFFGGVTAFPKSDTKVTGLKYKKMYPSVKAKKHWYDYLE